MAELNMKPILFNTEMVRAILDGRKTVTRRIIPLPNYGYFMTEPPRVAPRHRPGDILYVRETWCNYGKLDINDRVIEGTEEYYFRADGENPTPFNDFLVQHPGWDEHRETPVWHPSIHMPREAARIFLRVTDVRVERLQDITETEAIKEGCTAHGGNMALDEFEIIWDRTIKPADLPRCGWEANPWVWVIEFKCCQEAHP